MATATCTETKVKTVGFFERREERVLGKQERCKHSTHGWAHWKDFLSCSVPCDFHKSKEWSSCDHRSSLSESGRGGRKQENILLRFSCGRLISPSPFSHLQKVAFSCHQSSPSCPVPGRPRLSCELPFMHNSAQLLSLTFAGSSLPLVGVTLWILITAVLFPSPLFPLHLHSLHSSTFLSPSSHFVRTPAAQGSAGSAHGILLTVFCTVPYRSQRKLCCGLNTCLECVGSQAEGYGPHVTLNLVVLPSCSSSNSSLCCRLQ